VSCSLQAFLRLAYGSGTLDSQSRILSPESHLSLLALIGPWLQNDYRRENFCVSLLDISRKSWDRFDKYAEIRMDTVHNVL